MWMLAQLAFSSQASTAYMLGMVCPYKVKIKWFWKYNILNEPKTQESMNKQMLHFSLR